MSNNIYDILKKMAGLETPKAALTESKKAKPDFLDMDKDGDTEESMKKAVKDKKQGAIAEAVARVEQQLAEKYQGFKKAQAAGNMEEDSVEESGLQAYLGKKKYGETGMKALQKAGREGANKEKMAQIRAHHDKMDEADMEEGNEFSGELTKARAQGKDSFKVDGKTYPVKEGFPTVSDAEKRMREKEGKGSKGKIEKTPSGLRHTRDYEADDGMDGEGKPAEKKKGRPKGTGGGAKFSFKKPKD